MPLRILYIVSTLARCGPVNVLHGIVKHLDRSEFEPVILTLSEEKGDSIKQDFIEMGAECHTLGLSRLEFLLFGKGRLRASIDQIKPDLIHTHGYRADIAVSSFPASRPVFTTIHNNPLEDYRYTYGCIVGSAAYYRHLSALRKIAHPVVVGEHIKIFLIKRIKHHIDVIENGIEPAFYTPMSELEKSQRRSEIGLKQGSVVFIYTGGLSKRKDPERLIRAFRESSLYQSAYLIVVGSGPLYRTCARYADERIHITGSVKDVRGFLNAADVYISCSKSEGTPMSVLEAMASGLSLLLSDIPAHREILTNRSECGMVFASSENALIDALNMSSDRIEIGRKGALARQAVISNYSSQGMSARYATLYKRGFSSTIRP